MKRILFIFSFILVVFTGNSQIITNINIQGIDCNHTTGYAAVSTDIPAAWFIFKQYDDLTMSYVTIQSSTEDSVVLNSCSNVSVEVLNSSFVISDDSTFFVSCPMETDVQSHENIECHGDCTGSLKHVVSGGIPFNPDGIPNSGDEYYNYSWYQNGTLFSSGPNDTILTNLCNGQSQSVPYLLYVEDSTGCIFQSTDSLTGLQDTSFMFQHDLLSIDPPLINSVGCKGDSTGSFEIWVRGGKRFDPNNSIVLNDTLDGDEYYHYYLLNDLGDTVARSVYPDSLNFLTISSPFPLAPEHVKFSGLFVGNYTIHVVDLFGCTFDSTIYVMEPDNYALHVSTNPNIICEQDSTWLKIDSISGGHPNLAYNWIGTSSDSIYVRAGTYTSSIIDSTYGCKDSVDYTLTAPNTIYCDVTSTIAECFGTNTGSLQVDSIYGGVSPYSVQWGGIDTNNLFAGQYTLFITDYLGCIYMEDHEVFENPDVFLNETIIPPLCSGDANGSVVINISGGTPPLNYFWLNGTGGPDSLFSLPASTYVLQTTDSLGCTFLDSVVMSEPDDLAVNFGGYTNPLFCNGGQTLINAVITGGTGDISVMWNSNPVDTNLQIIAPAGIHQIWVEDENGCNESVSIFISEPDQLNISVNVVQATCNVGGSAAVTHTGGTLPISYIWSNGDTTSNVADLVGGDQWVIVTDSCGDTTSFSFTIDSYDLEADVDHYNNPVNFAEVFVTLSTVGGPFTYQWYDENMNVIQGEVNYEMYNLCEAWYYVITSDINSCTVLDSVYATLYLPLGEIIDENITTVYPDSLLWGSDPYTYLWDNGDVTAHGNLCPGFHRVWVTDVGGCEMIGEVIVPDFTLTLSPSDILVECNIENLDVELKVNLSGGTGNYSYLWSNGDTTNPISLLLNPGVYSVSVIDDNDCVVDTSFTIASMSADCIPNVFTPNDDGINDVWNLEDAHFFSDSEVRVYGRYGKLLFKSVGYSTPWDGTNEKGNSVEDGAYFYVIDLGNDIEKIKGTVTIIR